MPWIDLRQNATVEVTSEDRHREPVSTVDRPRASSCCGLCAVHVSQTERSPERRAGCPAPDR